MSNKIKISLQRTLAETENAEKPATIKINLSKLKLDAVSNLFQNDCSYLKLKSDHENRPLWISEDGTIYLEAFSPVVDQAQDFLVAISEPVSRPTSIHEYKLTPYSLYAAVSIGLQTEDIINVLNRLCKTPVPQSIEQFIRDNTVSFGKVKLVLKQNRYFIESTFPDTLQMLLKDEIIMTGIKKDDKSITESKAPSADDVEIAGLKNSESKVKEEAGLGVADDFYDFVIDLDKEEDGIMDDTDRVFSFEIKADAVETIRKRCNQIDYPVIEEYDFHNDATLPNLDVDLKPTTVIRSYQEKCLSKMFGNGRARSGIIVLPCGAGKTLVGITAACTIKKSIIILCTSAVSVEQWRSQFRGWSNISDKSIARFTSDSKEKFQGDAGVLISTYTMLAYSGKRSWDAQKIMDFITAQEWGLVLLDEVHVVPANVFRKVLTTVKAHAKLGLTATLVREDDKITDLNFLIGPKLYESNWLDLSKQGHIATVQCAEVWCPMTPEFYAEYLKSSSRKRKLLYVMNPNKFRACQFLIEYFEKRGDKIIVFSDDVFALQHYAKTLMKPFICGPTSQTERMRVLDNFRYDPKCNTIFLSKVGDTSIDLPEATCLIQISSHYGSRRQEAQRLGRILRAKRRNDEGFNAFFYSLVSKDTVEMYYSTKRQQFLIDQGYAFKVITDIPPSPNTKSSDPHMSTNSNLVYSTKEQQMKLLNEVLLHSEKSLDDDEEGVVIKDDITQWETKAAKKVTGATIKSLSGADNMAYIEINRSNTKKEPERNRLFKKYMGK